MVEDNYVTQGAHRMLSGHGIDPADSGTNHPYHSQWMYVCFTRKNPPGISRNVLVYSLLNFYV